MVQYIESQTDNKVPLRKSDKQQHNRKNTNPSVPELARRVWADIQASFLPCPRPSVQTRTCAIIKASHQYT